MTDTSTPSAASEDISGGDAADLGGALGKKGLSWAAFEWARNPYYNLVVIYVFAPYFAEVIVGDEVLGQALTARTITIAGIVTALTTPFLGAAADRGGRRKPIIAAIVMLMASCAFLLWWVQPGAVGFGVVEAMFLMGLAYCCYTYSEVLHNTLLPFSARPQSLPYVSGMGYLMGNFASVGLLIFVLTAFLLPGVIDWPFIASTPLFDLDKTAFEPQRIVGPLTAIWMVVFMIPFFLFMPDIKDDSRSWRQAFSGLIFGDETNGSLLQRVVGRLKTLGAYLVGLFREQPVVMRYLVARTIYADGMAALLTLGAVYVTLFMGWSGIEVLLYGILASLFAGFGGVVGGWLDRKLGPKLSLVLDITMMLILLMIQLSITPDALLFGLIPAGQTVWDGPIFQTLADVVYVGLVAPVAIFVVASLTSSRYMLLHLAPPERLGEFYGLYAIAGTVTVWMGPGLVDLTTSISGSLRLGMASISILFAIGLLILLTVKSDRTPEHMKTPAPE